MKIKNGTQFKNIGRHGKERIFTIAVIAKGFNQSACLLGSFFNSYTGEIHPVKDARNIQPDELALMMGDHPEWFELVEPEPPLLPECSCGLSSLPSWGHSDVHKVFCPECGAQTPPFFTEEEAENCWRRMMGADEI